MKDSSSLYGLAPRRIIEVARELRLDPEGILPHGHYIAKIPISELEARAGKPDGQLILVSAMTPTPQGEGKTTATIGLADALRRLGKRTMFCLREPSLGPYFGIKGGGTGGGAHPGLARRAGDRADLSCEFQSNLDRPEQVWPNCLVRLGENTSCSGQEFTSSRGQRALLLTITAHHSPRAKSQPTLHRSCWRG